MRRVTPALPVRGSREHCCHRRSRAQRHACTSASTTTRTSATRNDAQQMLDQAQGTNTTIVRTLVTWANIAPTRPANASNPFDSAYRFHDLDELVRNTQERDMEVLITIWGTPKWANGGKTPNYAADAAERPDRVLTRGRLALLGPLRRLPVRALLLDLERVEPAALPRTAVRRARASRSRRGTTRSSPPPPTPGSRRATRARRSRSAARRRPAATSRSQGKSATHSPGRFAQLVAAANPRLKFDAWAQHPYPVPANQKPNQKVRWPNVTLSSFAALREVARHVVQAQERPDLDHRVRPRGEAGRRAEGHLARAAGRLRGAGARAREERPADGHVHLVRLPRPRDERVAERPPDDERRREAVARRASAPLRCPSTRGTRS